MTQNTGILQDSEECKPLLSGVFIRPVWEGLDIACLSCPLQAEGQQNARKKETAALRGFCYLRQDLKKEEKYSGGIKIFRTKDKETICSKEITSSIL